MAGNTLQSLGYFLPYAYLPTYTRTLTPSPLLSTLLLALVNTTSIPGGILLGHLTDSLGVRPTILVSTLGSALAVFLFWGLSERVPMLAVFALTYGFFAGGFSSTWSGVCKEVERERPGVDTGFVFGLLAGGRGVGNVVSGPVSGVLGTREGWIQGRTGLGIEGEFGGVILFTGVTALLGGWGVLGRGWGRG